MVLDRNHLGGGSTIWLIDSLDLRKSHPKNLASWKDYRSLHLGCEPCKHITPTFEALSDQTTDLTFLLVDVDDKTFGFEFSRAHEVRAMPTFQIIVDGVKVSELVGADPEKLLVRLRCKVYTSFGIFSLNDCNSALLS
ncbi:thioredoxin [Puccinia sorghi]|uniref:Thioredoxin n=1 Tax=Puccinia sorghi TaxID=27349 RepID=A0A0L6V6L0_9BASI|nr:thioredoxin [Puccinia sorghi]